MWRRRLRRIGLVLLVILVALLAWEPSRVALQTAVMLPTLLDAGPQPLQLFSEAPQRSSIPYRTGTTARAGDLAELWLPAWAGPDRPAGAMLLVFGVNNLGRNHPVIERVADGLARSGVATLVPDSRTLLEGRLEVGEIDGVVEAFRTLLLRPEVDRERVGMVGFSVGGSLALLAAGDARIRDQVRWVNAFGAYADAGEYLASVAAHAYRAADGSEVDWTPTPLAREVYLQFLLDQVDRADERRALDDAFGEAILAGDRPTPDRSVRDALETDAALAIHDLLLATSLAEARTAIAGLTDEAQAFIDAISPAVDASRLSADVYLMHEIDDHHVPYVQSDRLAEIYGGSGTLVEYTRFRLFDHVQPDDLDLLAAAPELWKLLWHVHGLMVETL